MDSSTNVNIISTEEHLYNAEGFSLQYPWLTMSTINYAEEDGWQFVEYKNFLDKKTNEKVSESDYYNGVRYLRVKLMGNMTADRFNSLKDVDPEDRKQRRFCKVLDSDMLTLDLTHKQVEDGYRYLKVYVPTGRLERGWLTLSEQEDGWDIAYGPTTQSLMSKNKKRKLRKIKNDSKIMEDVKKYISIE